MRLIVSKNRTNSPLERPFLVPIGFIWSHGFRNESPAHRYLVKLKAPRFQGLRAPMLFPALGWSADERIVFGQIWSDTLRFTFILHETMWPEANEFLGWGLAASWVRFPANGCLRLLETSDVKRFRRFTILVCLAVSHVRGVSNSAAGSNSMVFRFAASLSLGFSISASRYEQTVIRSLEVSMWRARQWRRSKLLAA